MIWYKDNLFCGGQYAGWKILWSDGYVNITAAAYIHNIKYHDIMKNMLM